MRQQRRSAPQARPGRACADRGGMRRADVSRGRLSRFGFRRNDRGRQFGRWPIRRHLEVAGCSTTNAPGQWVRCMLASIAGACRRARYAGPTARPASSASRHRPIRSAPATDQRRGGGAISIGEVFRSTVVGDKPASRRTSRRHRGRAVKMSTPSISPTSRGVLILDLGKLGQAGCGR